MNRERIILWAALSLVGCNQPSVDPTETDNGLYGLGTSATKWPGGNVPVCFTNISDSPSLQQQIPGLLANSWSKAANIHFTGFGACNGGNVVSVSFSAGSNGLTSNPLGYGQESVTLINNDTTAGLAHFKYEVVHEFGHALGFQHEMQRPDNWTGGVAAQCPQFGNNAASQFNPVSGGNNLTPLYDPFSIMNYCDPGSNNQTQLSVGDIIGSSSASAYGPSGSCSFPATQTACVAKPQLQYDSTFTLPSGCPSTVGNWVLQQVGGGTIPTTGNATTWLIGHQAEGGVTSGPPIGSTKQFQLCDKFGNCAPPFNITIADCGTRLDSVYVSYNQTLLANQGSTGFVTLEMVGPWMNYDYGIGATGSVTSNIPNATFTFDNGYSNNTACYPNCIGFIDMTIHTAFSTPVGNYSVTAAVYDPATNITRTTTVPVAIGACTPPPSSCAGYECGTFTGCGQSLSCGSCSNGLLCSSGHCCASGTSWDGYACTPPPCNCPKGFYCAYDLTCQRNSTCKPGTCM
jgi:hypothetical protein